MPRVPRLQGQGHRLPLLLLSAKGSHLWGGNRVFLRSTVIVSHCVQRVPTVCRAFSHCVQNIFPLCAEYVPTVCSVSHCVQSAVSGPQVSAWQAHTPTEEYTGHI